MKMTKYINLFLGFSVIAGLLGNSVSKKKNGLSKTISMQDPLSPFIGTWSNQEIDEKQRLLKITNEGDFIINDQPILGSITSISKQQLVFTDHYGYELIAKRHQNNTLSFYDDADEKNYLFVLTE
ncbi:DUF4828 domain-containing protein [Carnobacterium sp. 17-4]|uniref:DUF4828 domain-containing protein n=1 Tax=Carnobacterium sp. (strain 17-4) TaxID=208596 RepID=UPI0002F51243|nr:DUF4828 domain-containing protein [Carnobacterium sp. 17-4]